MKYRSEQCDVLEGRVCFTKPCPWCVENASLAGENE